MKTIARAMLALALPCLLFGQASAVDNPINPYNLLPGQINSRVVAPVNAALATKLTNPLLSSGDIIIQTSNGVGRLSIGSNGQCLVVVSGLPAWASCPGGGGGGSWGTIGGTITAQADLMALFNAKQATLTTGTASQYLAGDLTLKPFPAIPTISGSSLLKGTGGNAVPAAATDVSALFSGTGNCLYADGTRGDCSGGAGGGSPAGSVGAIQTNAGGGAFGAAVAGTDYVVPSDSRLTNARTPTAHASTHATGGTDVVTPAAIGAVANTDSRLSDARVPVSHATAHKNGGGDEVATATPAANAIPKADASGLLAASWIPDLSGAYVAVAAKGAANGVASLGAGAQIPIAQIPTGTTSSTVAAGNDSRLSDARTPTAHAASHKNGGTDEVATATPAANAIPKAGIGGTLAAGWFPVLNQNTTGNAATASALAANGTNCPAGQAAAGVDASGAAEGCFAPTASAAGTGTELQYRNGTSIGAVTGSSVSGNNVTIGGTLTAGGFATAYTGTAQVLELKQGTAPSAPAANSFQLGAPTSIPTAYAWKVPSADAAGVIASDGAGALSIKGIQGTDTKVLSAGTISGTGAGLCTDANGGATTSGCTFGSGSGTVSAGTVGQIGVYTGTTTIGGVDKLTVAQLPGDYYAVSTGLAAGNSYNVTVSNCPTGYVAGERYYFKAHFNNTVAPTFNFCGLGSVFIKKPQGSPTTDLVADDIRSGQSVILMYDGTNMQMVSQLGNSGGGNVSTGVTMTSGQLAVGAGTTNVSVGNLSGDVTTSGGTATTIASGAVTPAKSSTALKTETSCVGFGADNAASDLVDADLGPQGNIFKFPVAATIIEAAVSANAGTPKMPILQKNHFGGSSWSATDVTSAALATGASGIETCAATGATCASGVAKDGTVTIVTTGSANVVAAGDYLQTKTGTGFASTGAKRVTVCVTWTRN